MIRVAVSLARREFTRFARQPQRVIGAIAQPLMFWAFLGAGMGTSFKPAGMEQMTYLEYFYPGVMVMMLLFASIFSCITIIEDRDAGFLQGVLVAPVSRLAIVLGKVMGSVLIALVQVLLFTIAAPFLGLSFSVGGFLLLLAGFVLTGTGFAALGFLIAWGMKSTSGFHAVMMVFLMPLWMLSGALFPVSGAAGWINVVMAINPVHHALNIIRAPFYGDAMSMLASPAYLLSLAVTIAWAVVCLILSMKRVEKREKGA
ncbi:putative transporter subunit: membrane component of ABC superfamily [Magnetospirillum sp. LM-5]|uniref:ABC transporter permease n=1 Tax=Magnetospirillum sp. LM-5 TaxID=2681466 RepID=UPI00137E4F7F|nr:ABC transporter permease [Magnetospirillum sp. LM-5]CAA7624916.1 putative transporter subunit: membrane component of ABC superfamily [Magnetospirillum sp. LM-5]